MKKSTRNIIIIVAAVVAAIGIVLAIVLPITLRPANELYTVTFNSNGGTSVDSITNIEKNSTISEPAAPTRDGYTFKGWYSDSRLTKGWNFETDKVKGNITLYAKWEFVPTNDLQMLLNESSYTVVGIGNATNVEDLVIPSSYKNLPVKTIAVNAFANAKSITSVFIPDSVTSIKDCAFLNCENLKTVTIAGKVEMGERVFEDCSKLERATLPDNLTEIKPKTFRSCVSLTDVNVPSSITSIGEQAFYECKSLTSFNFPSTLTTIGDQAFSSCENIKEVKLPSTLKTLGWNVFSGCIRIESLSVASNNSGNYYSEGDCIISMTPDENGQFVHAVVVGCKNSVIPSRVTEIGDGAFNGCRTLTNAGIIPVGITKIGDHAFSGCDGLKSISIPSSVISIGDYAFANCSYLSVVAFVPDASQSNVRTIGKEAFAYCDIERFTIPQSVAFIGAGALYMCPVKTVAYTGSSDQLSDVTIGKVGEGEDNPYRYAFNIMCATDRSEVTITGLA